MNKIFKVIYSKTRHCYVVVSELAKSHVKSSHGNGGQQKAALTMSVLLALGAFTFAFGPANAEAADENHYTEGQQYIGVYHTSNDTANAENHQGGLVSKNQGALGVGAISIGVHAEAGTGTITIGNRLAPSAQDSVFIGSKYDAENKVYKTASSKVVSIGADSNAHQEQAQWPLVMALKLMFLMFLVKKKILIKKVSLLLSATWLQQNKTILLSVPVLSQRRKLQLLQHYILTRKHRLLMYP